MALIKILFTTALLFTYTGVAHALNIVLTNDDGWETHNIRVLKAKLLESGHNVILSAPCLQQSGKGGAMHIFKTVPVDDSQRSEQEFCVGDTDKTKPYKDFVEGTPAMASLYGIDVLAKEYFGGNPDLLISGPNQGNNLGIMNNNSGTLGAAIVGIGKGVPTIAVSASIQSMSDSNQAPVIADKVLAVISLLEKSRSKGKPLLPKFTGLNVNLPADLNASSKFKFSKVGWNPGYQVEFTGDFSQSNFFVEMTAARMAQAGKVESLDQGRQLAKTMFKNHKGVAINPGNLGDKRSDSEAHIVGEGYISISVIDGSIQADNRKTKKIRKRLKGI